MKISYEQYNAACDAAKDEIRYSDTLAVKVVDLVLIAIGIEKPTEKKQVQIPLF